MDHLLLLERFFYALSRLLCDAVSEQCLAESGGEGAMRVMNDSDNFQADGQTAWKNTQTTNTSKNLKAANRQNLGDSSNLLGNWNSGERPSPSQELKIHSQPVIRPTIR